MLLVPLRPLLHVSIAPSGLWILGAQLKERVPHTRCISPLKSSSCYLTLTTVVLSPQKLGLLMHQITHCNGDLFCQHLN